MSRYPIPPASTLTPKQKEIEPKARNQMYIKFPHLIYKEDGGQLLGPFPSLYYTPDLVDPWFDLANAVLSQKCFGMKERELVCLAVMAAYDSPYVLYAHSEIAKKVGLSEGQIQQAVEGVCPDELSREESVVYVLALTLARFRSPLSDQDFKAAEDVIGKEKIASVAHLVTAYIHVSMLTNIGSAGYAPAPKEGLFYAKKGPNIL